MLRMECDARPYARGNGIRRRNTRVEGFRVRVSKPRLGCGDGGSASCWIPDRWESKVVSQEMLPGVCLLLLLRAKYLQSQSLPGAMAVGAAQ